MASVVSEGNGRWNLGAPRMMVAFSMLTVLCSGCKDAADGSTNELTILTSLAKTEPCPKSPGGPVRPVVELTEESRFPCRIVAVATGVELKPSADDRYPDPNPYNPLTGVVMDHRGRYFVGTRDAAIVSWNADGSFRGVISVPQGKGPGELSGPPSILAVDESDDLYVYSDNRWLVYDSAMKYVRMFTATGEPSAVHVMDRSRLVFATSVPDAPDSVFHIIDSAGVLVRSAGTPRQGRAEFLKRNDRSSVYSPATGLWIVPAPGTKEGMVIERWSLDGKLTQLIKRSARWLPIDGYSDLEGLPKFAGLNVDEDGLLWVAVVVKDRRYAPLPPGEIDDAHVQELYDVRFEVIDPIAGAVIASTRFDISPEVPFPPVHPVVAGKRRTFALTADSLGQLNIRFYDLHLVKNDQ